MPANLPIEARAKWIKVMEAKTKEEKLIALREFLACVPKHKGTEKLIKQVRRQIAILRKELEKEKIKKSSKGVRHFVKKEGAAQVLLLGLTNSGKSTILSRLTNASPRISSEPFTTKRPVAGMMECDGVKIQLVEGPAIVEGSSEGVCYGNLTLAIARNADILALVIDLSYDPIYQLKVIEKELKRTGIILKEPSVVVTVEKKSKGGIIVIGELKNCSYKDVVELLHNYGIYHAYIKIVGEASLDDIEESIRETKIYKPVLVIATKVDMNKSKHHLDELRKILQNKPLLVFSNHELVKIKIRDLLLEMLNLIRVYTRNPLTKEVAKVPIVVKKGTTVIEVAKMIHSQLYRNFKYAKVWRKSFGKGPRKVGKNFMLEDRDIVEIIVR